MKRKKLDTTICGLQDLVSTIERLKKENNDKETQIEVSETSLMKNCFYVIIWEVK